MYSSVLLQLSIVYQHQPTLSTLCRLAQDEDEAIMVMGDEEYDEPDQLLAGLPERVLLSDFVDSQEPIMNAIAKVRASMTS